MYLHMKGEAEHTHTTFICQIVIGSHLMPQKPGEARAEWTSWHRLTCSLWFHRLKDHFPHGVVKEIQIPIAKDHFGKTVLKFFVGHFILGTTEHQYFVVFFVYIFDLLHWNSSC